ncbi:MAG: hypothetical protein ABFD44_05965, partial [Anaerolineaceae bacterium]
MSLLHHEANLVVHWQVVRMFLALLSAPEANREYFRWWVLFLALRGKSLPQAQVSPRCGANREGF